jgi:hypothetical protein
VNAEQALTVPSRPTSDPHPTSDRPTNHSLIASPSQHHSTARAHIAIAMCLVKVKQEEDVVVPYRVVQRNRSPPRRHSHQSTRRVSRTEIVRESPRPSATYIARESPRPSASYIAVPPPRPIAVPAIPPPQPVPVFVEQPPAPPPPPPMSHHSAHYVEVSPRSSFSSSSASRGDYVVREKEYRRETRRDRSEERSPRYEHFRYVEPAPSESDHYERFDRRRSRSRVRERSASRGAYDYGRGSRDYHGGGERERITRERISIVEGDGRRRRREYRD